jgi:hypothetical protein
MGSAACTPPGAFEKQHSDERYRQSRKNNLPLFHRFLLWPVSDWGVMVPSKKKTAHSNFEILFIK